MNIIKKLLFILILLLLLFSLTAIASENTVVEIYNKGEKVELSYVPIDYNEDLFISIDDLGLLNLEVDTGTSSDDYHYKIEAKDFLGATATLILEKASYSSFPDVSFPVENNLIYDLPVLDTTDKIIPIPCKKTISKRNTWKIGDDFLENQVVNPDLPIISTTGYLIEYNGKKYISCDLIASTFSYSYTETTERIDLFLPSKDTVVIESEIYINEGLIIPEGGIRAEIKIAEKKRK